MVGLGPATGARSLDATGGAAGGSGTQSAGQMATLWDQYRSTQLKATQLTGQIAAETQRRAQLQSKVAAYTAQIASFNTQIATFNSEIAQAQARMAADAAQLNLTDQQLAALEGGIGVTTQQAEAMKAQVQARAIDIYKQGPASYLGMLLDAHNFRDFLSRVKFVGQVVDTDRSKLTALEQLTSQLGQQKGEATQHRADVAAAKAGVEAESARITSLRKGVSDASAAVVVQIARQQTVLGDVQALLGDQKALLAQVEAQKAVYLEAMATLVGESSSIAEMLRARQIDESFGWAGRTLLWPVTGPISSPFGPRINPIFDTPEFHTGIDIAVDYGLPVKAAEAGQVVSAGLMEGYGNVVIVDHGGALATLYAHMSSLSVHAGQKVARGEQLGAIGCTGLCTGPHLHFETRIGGTPVQPLNLLP